MFWQEFFPHPLQVFPPPEVTWIDPDKQLLHDKIIIYGYLFPDLKILKEKINVGGRTSVIRNYIKKETMTLSY